MLISVSFVNETISCQRGEIKVALFKLQVFSEIIVGEIVIKSLSKHHFLWFTMGGSRFIGSRFTLRYRAPAQEAPYGQFS